MGVKSVIRDCSGVTTLIILMSLSLVAGQTVNIGSKITSIGSSFSFPVVATIPINGTDLIVVVSGVFAGDTQIRWFWYRNQLNADLQTLQTSEVANLILSYTTMGNPIAVRAIKGQNYALLIYLTDKLVGQPIDISNSSSNSSKKYDFAGSTGVDFDRSFSPLFHTRDDILLFSLIYGARNTTNTCVYRSTFDNLKSSFPRELFCPGLVSSVNKTNMQAWNTKSDNDTFFVASSYPNKYLVTQKCWGASEPGYIACAPISQVQLPQTITQSYGRLLSSSEIFIFVGTSDGSPLQVVAIDPSTNTSTTITIPISITGTRIIALEDSTNPNAVMMIIYDSSIPGFQVIDIVWNSNSSEITYNAVSNFTSANMFTLTGVDIPAASLSPSMFTIATASTDAASQVSTQFFSRRLCGDGLVILGEECDSVAYCDTLTCTCIYGVESFNICKPPPVPVSSSTPTSSPSSPSNPATPLSSPIVPPIGDTPIGNSSPVSPPASNGTAQTGTDNNGTTPSDGIKVEVVVPAIVVPIVVVAAGIILLVLLLKRRKQKKNPKSEVSSSSEQNFSPKSVMLEPVNYFSVPATSPELGKDSNTSTGSNMTDKTVVNSLHGFDVTLNTIATTAMQSKTALGSMDDRMDIPYSELKFTREIGAGAYGKVFLGEWQKTNVALKISSVTSSDEFVREAELIINLRPHPNVVQVLGMSSDGVNVVMIMEFCDGGSLDSLVFKKNPPMKDKIHFLSGIAKGIYHLHKNKIVHRDLAARNILLSRGEPKISDFGMSRKLQDATAHGTTKATVGPIRWMAPECLRTVQYSTKSDVWSFGILCWEVLSGEEPHMHSDPLMIGVAIRDQGVTPVMNNEWDPALQSLMKDCWKLEPDQRPDFDEICERLSRLDK